MIYLLLIIAVLAAVIILYVPQFAGARAKMMAWLAAFTAAISGFFPEVQDWLASFFGG